MLRAEPVDKVDMSTNSRKTKLPVGFGDEQAVQGSDEDGPLDGKIEMVPPQKLAGDHVDAQAPTTAARTEAGRL